MPIDTFISCSTRDRDVAEAISTALNASGVTCWSPLDLKPDEPATAPDRFRLVVLVFSSRAGKSRRVIKEIEHAIARQMPIVTLCVEDVRPRPPFDILAASDYWRNGRRTSLAEHMEQILYWVTMLLARLDMGSKAQTLEPVKPGYRPGHKQPNPATQRMHRA